MSVKKILGSVSLIVLLSLSWGVEPRAGLMVHRPVTFWNNVAAASATAGRPGLGSLLDIAVVQLAVHDAVQAIERRYDPYRFSDPSASGMPQAAVAAASYHVLATLYPAQRPGPAGLDQTFADYVAKHGLGGDPGLGVGAAAAAELLEEYRPLIVLPPNTGSTETGQWRPTPPANTPAQFEFLAETTPFTLLRASQFRPQPPPPLTSGRYLRDYDEVKAFGAVNSTARTAPQTDMAHFWSENFITQWNRAVRGIIDGNVADTGEGARLLALTSVASADAVITVWDSKFHFNFWRPITAIREGDNDPNPDTIGDPAWTPLIATPPYSDYTSGANGLTAAFTGILAMFFGTDDYGFQVTSNAPAAIQKTRNYVRFSDAAQEVVDARIFLGIHFRFADEEARRQGNRVAHWVFQNFLKPTPGAK